MALSLDGTASGNAVAASVVTGTLTCANAGNVICVAVLINGGISVTSVTGTGATFTRRTATPTVVIELWTGYAAGTFSSTITVDVSPGAFCTVHAWGVSGCPSSSYFDVNGSLPDIGATDPRTVSTTAADTFIIGAFRMTGTASPTEGSGFTKILGNNFCLTEYKIVSAAQSGLSVPIGTGVGDANGGIGDALVMAAVAALQDDYTMSHTTFLESIEDNIPY